MKQSYKKFTFHADPDVPSSCRRPVDLCFLVACGTNINQAFYTAYIVEFLQTIVANLDVDSGRSQVSAITFSDTARVGYTFVIARPRSLCSCNSAVNSPMLHSRIKLWQSFEKSFFQNPFSASLIQCFIQSHSIPRSPPRFQSPVSCRPVRQPEVSQSRRAPDLHPKSCFMALAD